MATDLNASMANLRVIHEQSACKQQQIQDLQQEKRKLDVQFEEQLLQHAQADCKQLATMMHAKLPQELKELIYQYLYIEDAPIPVGSYHFTTYVPEPLRSDQINLPGQSEPFIIVPEDATRQDHSIERDENIIYPDSWLLDPAYLGHTVARDASRYYYKSNTFSVCTLENALHDFLFRDPFHNFLGQQTSLESAQPLGLLPIDQIRNLQIRVKYEHYNTYLTFYDTLHDGERNLLRDIFDTLHGFTSRISPAAASQLHVEFCLMTAYPSLHTNQPFATRQNSHMAHINLLEAIRVPVYTLKHDLGADITITHYDENLSPFPKTISGIFQLSRKQWSYEKNTLLAAAVEYSPLHYYISGVQSTTGPEGFNARELRALFRERWGLASSFATSCSEPIREGKYWPVGGTNPWELEHSGGSESGLTNAN